MSVNNPTLSTTTDQTSVTLGPPVTLKDTADLEGGSNPTGSITFTLVGPDGTTVVDTEMVLVNGNGLYSTPTGFTPGVTPSGPDLTGTYQWNATYSGDANNNAASDIDDPKIRRASSRESPTISTIPDPTSNTLGPPVTPQATADPEGAFNPRGSMPNTVYELDQ